MSEIGKPGNYPFTITLVRVIGETWEDYIERCQDITNYVSGKHPKLPDEIRLVNLDNFTQVSETAYEIIAPSYEPQEEAGNERDTHFAGYTELLYPDLARLFIVMQEYMATGEEDKAKMVETVIKDVLTRRSFDLVFKHALVYLREGADIPDMTEWPK